MKTALLVLSFVLVPVAVPADGPSYSRYESLAMSQMFGPLPEGFDPTRPPSEAVSSRAAQKTELQLSKEQAKLKSAIRFSMINVTPSGETAVGFTDSSDPKKPINYYLREGETRDGWTVLEADAGEGTMTVVKGDVEVSLSIGGDSAKGAGTTSAVGAAEAPSGETSSARSGRFGSMGARRNQRRAAENARMEAIIDKKVAEKVDEEKEKLRREDQLRRENERGSEAESATRRAQLLELSEEIKREREEKPSEREQGISDSGEQHTTQDDDNQ